LGFVKLGSRAQTVAGGLFLASTPPDMGNLLEGQSKQEFGCNFGGLKEGLKMSLKMS
jgi:hypothetical protein